MPPKWALGYFQSHRTLAGPEEPVAIAKTFREKKLPCDAVIYLGTGYCPAGWNLGHASLEFNPATFDKPAAMIDALHDADFKVVLHVNAPPLRLTGNEMKRVAAAEESGDPASPPTADISDYWARHRATFALGADGWWPDDGDELDRESRIARRSLPSRAVSAQRLQVTSFRRRLRSPCAAIMGARVATVFLMSPSSWRRSGSSRRHMPRASTDSSR